jgi:uncharacterized sodium:solute symporter family permease YidK
MVVAYAIFIFGLAQWVSRRKGDAQEDSAGYFLASRALPWWAIGASLIAANISAEQIVGMAGSGYAIGLAISSMNGWRPHAADRGQVLPAGVPEEQHHHHAGIS